MNRKFNRVDFPISAYPRLRYVSFKPLIINLNIRVEYAPKVMGGAVYYIKSS